MGRWLGESLKSAAWEVLSGLDSDVEKLLADDCGHELSALELVTSFIIDTQIQPLHVLVGLILGKLETFEPNGAVPLYILLEGTVR